MPQPLIACCDIGGTKMLVGLVTLEGEVLATERYPLRGRNSPEAIADDLDAAINRLLAKIGRPRADIGGMGCSTTGVMDIDTGVVFMNHNLDWSFDVPFGDILSQRLNFPVVLEMDANAAALGEFWTGSGRDYNSFIYIIVGTGIGAGIILNGQPVHGAHSSAGEIGHTVIVPGGQQCGCGKHGCLEALSAGVAIARRGNAAITLKERTVLHTYPQPITAAHVAQAAREGDSTAQGIIDDAARYLGIAIANFITLFDPEAIILGGGVALGAFDILSPTLNRSIQAHLNYWAKRDTPIMTGTLGEHAGLVGAGRAALDRLPVFSNHKLTEVNTP